MALPFKISATNEIASYSDKVRVVALVALIFDSYVFTAMYVRMADRVTSHFSEFTYFLLTEAAKPGSDG